MYLLKLLTRYTRHQRWPFLYPPEFVHVAHFLFPLPHQDYCPCPEIPCVLRHLSLLQVQLLPCDYRFIVNLDILESQIHAKNENSKRTFLSFENT